MTTTTHTDWQRMETQPPEGGDWIRFNGSDEPELILLDRQEEYPMFYAAPPHRPGERVAVLEPWMLSCFIDVASAYPCSEEDLHALKYVLQFKDADGDWQTYRTIWPRDKDYAACKPLVTCYADEGRERTPEELPSWAA